MPCPKVNKAKALFDKYDLKKHLISWRKGFPAETQLDGGSSPNPKPWVHFKNKPIESFGSGFVWKLSGDTTASAVDRFINGEELKLDKTSTGAGCLRLGADTEDNGWNCLEVT